MIIVQREAKVIFLKKKNLAFTYLNAYPSFEALMAVYKAPQPHPQQSHHNTIFNSIKVVLGELRYPNLICYVIYSYLYTLILINILYNWL